MLRNRLLTGIAVIALTALAVIVMALLVSDFSPSAAKSTATMTATAEPAGDPGAADDTLAAHRETIQRVIAEVFNAGDVAVLEALYSSEFVAHLPPSAVNRAELSRDDLYEIVLLLHEAVPDLAVSSERVIAEGDYVVVQARLQGTFASEFYDFPPTGKPLEMTFIVIHRFDAEGAIAEAWVSYDTLALRQQFGLETGE
ncbi:MAG: ester cyclase [Anaerolineae bacterium]|nr:ester cyclase [Anaerolineae bacterium]